MDQLDLERLIQERDRRAAAAAKIEAEREAAEQQRIHAETRSGVEQERAAEEEKAKTATSRSLIAKLTAALRGFYHPKQGRFFTSKARRRATKKTRRSGATAGGCRELIARAVEIPRFRAVYITTTRVEARARAWRNDTQSGLVDVIERYGSQLEGSGVPRFDMGSVIVEVRDGDLALRFSNGSLIELFGADDEAAIMKLRGLAKHVYWVDEAQDFQWLERLYKSVVFAGMSDFGAEVWLTGTPSRDLVGMFFEVTRDDVEDRMVGWEVHEITVTDNPFFGRVVWELGQWFVEDNLFNAPDADQATHPWTDDIAANAHRWGPFDDEDDAAAAAVKVRWERAAAAEIRENGLSEDDPDVLREWKARWVKEGARYVYALHAVAEHAIVYAQQRFADDGFPDLRAAMLDLPGVKDEQRAYFTAAGADLGTRDAFAWVVWAWSLKDPILYELASWKKTGLDYDEMAQYLVMIRAQINLSLIVADAGGGGKPAVMGWSKRWMDRYHIPITEAKKSPGYKPIAIKQMNTDVRKLWLRLRKDSPLMCEWKVHRWAPIRDATGKEVEDPRTPNHCSDGGLYAHMECYHHRYRPPEVETVRGTPEWAIREAQELEAANCEQADLYDPYTLYGSGR